MSMHNDIHNQSPMSNATPETPQSAAMSPESDSSVAGAPTRPKSVLLWHTGNTLIPTLKLVNFNVCENGPCNFRDATVLGQHTALK